MFLHAIVKVVQKNPRFTVNTQDHTKTVLNPELLQVREIREMRDLHQLGNVPHALHLRDNNERERIGSLVRARAQ